MNRTFLSLAGAVTLASTATAQFVHQITYIDADCSTNTTLADGTAYTPVASTSGTDDEWALRAFGNGGTVLTTHDVTGSTEDAPMLRTTISGLIPGLSYFVYSYQWSDGQAWRLRAKVDTAIPAPPIQGWNAVHFNGSSFSPSQPLALGSYVGYNQMSLDLAFDAAGYETSGHFDSTVAPVLVQEGNRFMFEDWLGVHQADVNGEIQVYIDDLEGTQGTSNRTWYDGVGYEIAPFTSGTGCGNPVPSIGYDGAPIMTTSFAATVSNALPNALGLCIIGFDNQTWTGGPLPFSLAGLGFAGCQLEVADDVIGYSITDGSGFASFAVTLPGWVPPIALYWQWGVLDTSRNLVVTGSMETFFHQ